jgi:NTP pyrophosphatase (non-canonical NTP hydrolase)
MADVLFSALMIAKSLNIDVEKAMTNKMKKIKSRLEIE